MGDVGVGPLDVRELDRHAPHLPLQGAQAQALPGVRSEESDDGQHEHERADRQLLPAPSGALGFLRGEEIDAYHLSPGRRVARPAVTASAGPLACTSSRFTPRSTVMRRKGDATSTLHPSFSVQTGRLYPRE